MWVVRWGGLFVLICATWFTGRFAYRYWYHSLPAEVFCSQSVYNFGTTTPGTLIDHSYVLTNSGRRPVQLISVKTSCSCSAAEPKSRTIPPGESTTIHVTFNTSGMYGHVSQKVLVETDADKGKTVSLNIKGNVDFPWTPTNKVVRFEYPLDTERRKAHAGSTFVLKPAKPVDDLSVQLEGIPSFLECRVEINDTQTFNVHISLNEQDAPESFAAQVILKTKSEYPQYHFTVRGVVYRKYTIRPHKLVYVAKPGDSQTSVERSIVIQRKAPLNTPIEIDSLSVLENHDQLIEINNLEHDLDTVTVSVIINLNRITLNGEYERVIQITDVDGNKVDIPVSCVVLSHMNS